MNENTETNYLECEKRWVFADFLHADLTVEKDRMDEKPHGH